MRNAWLALIAVLLVLPQAATAGRRREPAVFTRHVEQLTGDWPDIDFWNSDGHGQVNGQDSAVLVEDPDRGRVIFLFGDTQVPGLDVSNSMAWTEDFDAADGIDLTYHLAGTYSARAVLAPVDEPRVWLMGGVVVGGDLFSYYYRVSTSFPDSPPSLGSGLAVMEGAAPPFVRTPLHFEPGTPLAEIGSVTVDGEHAYLFSHEVPAGNEGVTLARVPTTSLEDPSAYEFWTDSGWSATPEGLVVLFDNSNPPSVQWNPHLGQWLAIGNDVASDAGLLSRIVMRTAEEITGPWTEPTVLYGADGEGWGSCYNPAHSVAFDREGGRVFYVTATDFSKYNVDLYEISLERARADFLAVFCHDDGVQIPGAPPSLDTPAIELLPDGGSLVGLQLEGPSFFQGTLPSRARLVLPLAAPLAEAATLDLLIEAGVPNGPAFGDAEDIASRETLASVSVTTSALAGDEALVVEGDRSLELLLARSALHEAWSAGSPNRVMLRISQPAGEETVALASGEAGRPARLDACYGACEAFVAPQVQGTPCRLPDPDPGPASSWAELARREGCGIGFELAPILLVLVRLTRGAARRVWRRSEPSPAPGALRNMD